jgi:hypothetical protein
MAKGVSRSKTLKSERTKQNKKGKYNRTINTADRAIARGKSAIKGYESRAIEAEMDHHSKVGKAAYKKK